MKKEISDMQPNSTKVGDKKNPFYYLGHVPGKKQNRNGNKLCHNFKYLVKKVSVQKKKQQ